MKKVKEKITELKNIYTGEIVCMDQYKVSWKLRLRGNIFLTCF